jgi:hypothetical protein
MSSAAKLFVLTCAALPCVACGIDDGGPELGEELEVGEMEAALASGGLLNGADLPIPADFDGDGRADLAVFRSSTQQWFILRSRDGGLVVPFGGVRSDLAIPADYDADGRADLAVFRPRTGEWLRAFSGGSSSVVPFGNGSFIPAPADFDGDGRADLVAYRAFEAQWFIAFAAGGSQVRQFGAANLDRPVPADFDGDRRADFAVFRPDAARGVGVWLISLSGGGSRVVDFGGHTDIPVPADFDGDGRADLAVFRPQTSQWFILQTTLGGRVEVFGGNGGSLFDGGGQAFGFTREVFTASESQPVGPDAAGCLRLDLVRFGSNGIAHVRTKGSFATTIDVPYRKVEGPNTAPPQPSESGSFFSSSTGRIEFGFPLDAFSGNYTHTVGGTQSGGGVIGSETFSIDPDLRCTAGTVNLTLSFPQPFPPAF